MDIQAISAIAPSLAQAGPIAPRGGDFGAMVNQLLEQTNASQVESDQALVNLAAGNTDSVHEVVLSLAKAEMSFAFLLEVRNRVVDMYHDLMRMQV